jgi:hypothetical protein
MEWNLLRCSFNNFLVAVCHHSVKPSGIPPIGARDCSPT